MLTEIREAEGEEHMHLERDNLILADYEHSNTTWDWQNTHTHKKTRDAVKQTLTLTFIRFIFPRFQMFSFSLEKLFILGMDTIDLALTLYQYSKATYLMFMYKISMFK